MMVERSARPRRIGAVLTLGAVMALAAHAATEPLEWSVWDGAYSEAQAERGAVLFAQHCSACHGDRPGAVAGHGPAPAIVGEAFAFRWVDSAVADLYDVIRQTMPEAAPSSLSAAEYAAITAHVLALNGYPAGSTALDPSERERLLSTYIDASPPPADASSTDETPGTAGPADH
jgi:mono/diheme cytochrome c family protein